MSESFLQKSTLKFFAHAVHVRGVGQCRGLLAGGEGKRQRVSAALSVVVTSFSLSDLLCCVYVVLQWVNHMGTNNRHKILRSCLVV